MKRFVHLCVTFVLLLCAARAASATVRYRVSLAHPERHLFHVTVIVPEVNGELVVALPAWNALYQIRDFASRVHDMRSAVELNGKPGPSLDVRKLDKETWRVSAPAGLEKSVQPATVDVDYAIMWDDAGPFNSQLNAHHAFVNFAEILLYLPDRRAEQVEVEFADVPTGWRTAAELQLGVAPNTFVALSYDKLADAPTEIGTFVEFRFDAGGGRYRVVVDGADWKEDKLKETLSRIVTYETSLMGGPPFDEYTFFFHFGSFREAGGGGMEHANSTAIGTGSGDGAASVAAHEFFHLWNVKRIRPKTLEPVDYTREQWTRALWFAEGVTSTYGSYALVRSGIWTRAQFYGDLAAQFAELDARPARLWKSVEEASLDAWLEKYDAYRSPDVSISYYNKGQILGVLLDLLIRDATSNHASLDDVLRRMNEEFAKQNRTYDDSADIRAVAQKVAGRSFEDFFQRYVSGTEEISYDTFLALAGLRLKPETRAVADLGFRPGRGPGSSLSVSDVEPGSGAEAAGVREGDEVLGIGGSSSWRDVFRNLRERAPGETVRLRLRRDGEEREVSYALGSRAERNYQIEELPSPSERQLQIREGLLKGSTN
jgi:predicted metalloprotease with PDZ domain